MLNKINEMKVVLNKAVEDKELCHDEILKTSQELDKLIMDYYHFADLEYEEIGKE